MPRNNLNLLIRKSARIYANKKNILFRVISRTMFFLLTLIGGRGRILTLYEGCNAPPSSSGLGRSPLKAETGVRFPLGAQKNKEPPVMLSGSLR
jgi:hypothetical protein